MGRGKKESKLTERIVKNQKEVIPKDSRYVPLTQQPYCCVPTCIQIVMVRHNIPLVSAELMAHYMQIVVPKKDAKLFWNVRSSAKKPEAGYGTKLNESLTADPMFKKLGIPLRMKWHLINQFDSPEDIRQFMQRAIDEDRDILVCFRYGSLFNTRYTGGHTCVLDQIDSKGNKVRLVDPGRKVPKWRTVTTTKLFKAMKAHGSEKMGGFWEIEKRLEAYS